MLIVWAPARYGRCGEKQVRSVERHAVVKLSRFFLPNDAGSYRSPLADEDQLVSTAGRRMETEITYMGERLRLLAWGVLGGVRCRLLTTPREQWKRLCMRISG